MAAIKQTEKLFGSGKSLNKNTLPHCAKIATGLQALLTCLVFVVWGAWAVWGRFPYSLEASGVVFGPIVLLCATATLGLWKGKLFGWVAAIASSVVISLVLCFTAGPLCILPAGFLIFLLTPKVRDFYVGNYYE
jgi:ABC-type phosphate transport system permease subunit